MLSEGGLTHRRESDTVLRLKGALTGRSLDDELDDALCQTDEEPARLELDLSESLLHDVFAQQLLIALLRVRRRKHLSTLLRLPRTEEGLTALRITGFLRAVERATGNPFKKFVVEADHARIERLLRPTSPFSHQLTRGSVIELLRSDFMRFESWTFPRPGDPLSPVLDEAARWKSPLVLAVLSRLLSSKADSRYVASRIVFEAMLNAVRHPGAETVQTASCLNAGYFSLHFWDDGKGMVETVRDAIRAGRRIRHSSQHSSPENFPYSYCLNTGGRPKSYKSNWSPVHTSDDEEILLATILPGVTCDVNGHQHAVDEDLVAQAQPSLTQPGMGLFVLINTVVDVLKGHVQFRTGPYWMTVTGSGEKHYNVEVTRIARTVCANFGNTVSVRLPVNDTAVD